MKKLDRGTHVSKNILKTAITRSMLVATMAVSCHTAFAQSAPRQDTDYSAFIKGLHSEKAIPGSYIVVLKDDEVTEYANTLNVRNGSARTQAVQNIAVTLATRAGGELVHTYSNSINGFTVNSRSVGMVARLAEDPRVAFIEADTVVSIGATQNNATWGLDRIDQANLPLDNSYTYGSSGAGVDAYVVDTGVNLSHNEFGGRASAGYTAINDGGGANDCHGHGSHVAGTVAGSTYGVAKNANVIGVRVLGCDGTGPNSGTIAGLDWIVQNHSGPSVVNMSLGGSASTASDNAVQSVVNAGITVVVAAGNDNANACNYSPARAANAITVGSTANNDSRSWFSNYGSCLDIYAPGSDITSAWYNSNSSTNTISGTSMASPHVAGVAALYLGENSSASPAQVQAAIENVAVSGKVTDAKSGSPNLLLQNFDADGGGGPVDPPSGGNELSNGVAKTGLSGARSSEAFFTMEVPAGATDLSFVLSGGSGDADMYVKYGSAPTTSSYDCRPYKNGNNETCSFDPAQAGTYHVMLRGYSSFSGTSLTGSFTEDTGPVDPPATNYFENTDNVTISSGAANTVSSYINVTRTGASGSIRVKADIVHTYRGDLEVKIYAPTGESGTVHARTNSGDSGDDLTLDVSLNAGTIESSGQWRLEVIDHANYDGGYIDAWSIEFE